MHRKPKHSNNLCTIEGFGPFVVPVFELPREILQLSEPQRALSRSLGC